MELELKSQQDTDGYMSCFCGKPAIILVELGEVHAKHGSFFDICNDDVCLDKAFEICAQRIMSFKNKHQLIFPDEMVEYRESA